jgi:hypothetical protein
MVERQVMDMLKLLEMLIEIIRSEVEKGVHYASSYTFILSR